MEQIIFFCFQTKESHMNLPAVIICLIVGVSDGDTVTARCGDGPGQYEQIKVRLNGIDAPERKQPYGEKSRQFLSDLVYMKQVKLNCPKMDRYKRYVCSVWVAPASNPNGNKTLDAGLAMVTQGMAWWYRQYSREQTPQERGQYKFAEIEARAKKAGLWSDPDPIPPWAWRKKKRKE